MATVLVILCSVVGCITGLTGWLFFGLSPLVALGIWVGSGPVAAALITIFTAPESARSRATDDAGSRTVA
ncbi:MAG: hypothetical protein H3C51_01065 [Rubellimicrobium sp.]|nr:hypothetical protein [Rubellimicrobium sp.]